MFNIKNLLRVLVIILLTLAVCGPAGATTTVSWSSATIDDGSDANDFDTGTLTFSPIIASSVSFNDPGTAYYHDADIVVFQVRSGGDWQTIYSDSSVETCDGGGGGPGDVELSSLSQPIQFSTRQIDGFRFTWGGSCSGDWTYHDFSDSANFGVRFNDVARAIPTLSPTTMIIMALSLLLVGMYAGREYLRQS